MVIRVVTADDSFLIRDAVARLVEDEPDLALSEVADDYESLLAAVKDRQPDVVVTDVRMPPEHTDEGIRAAEAIRGLAPSTGALIGARALQGVAAALLVPGSLAILSA